MKNFIEISFPEKARKDKIVLKEKLVISPSNIFISRGNFNHIVKDIKFISLNDFPLGNEDITINQEIIFEGYYQLTKGGEYCYCKLKYTIYGE